MGENPKIRIFDLFRYQLVPKSMVQYKLFGKSLTYEQLVERKNTYFRDILLKDDLKYSTSRSKELVMKRLNFEEELFYFKLGQRKERRVQDKTFDEKTVEDFPNVEVFFNNNPSQQIIAISQNYQAFSSSLSVAKNLEFNFRNFLEEFNISIYIKPLFDKKDFWELTGKYEGKITQVGFELVKPNLANISGTFNDEFRELTDTTNSHTTKIELNAPENGVLENVNQNNKKVENLVDYASEGGGDISIKVKGFRRKFKTSKSLKEVSVDDFEIEGDKTTVLEIMNKLFKQ